MDLCAVFQSPTLCVSSHSYAIFHLCHYWNAGNCFLSTNVWHKEKVLPMKNERKICQIGFCYPRFSEAKLLSPILNTIVIIIFKPLWRVYWYFFGESYSISIPFYLVVLYLTFIHHPFSLLVIISTHWNPSPPSPKQFAVNLQFFETSTGCPNKFWWTIIWQKNCNFY